MIKLPQITLIAITGRDIEAHKKALDYSSKEITFGAIKLIEKHFETIDDWSYHIIYHLTDYIDTEFCILIHADGYIIHPELWRDEWLQYDYIGAPFPLPVDDFSYRDIRGNIQRVGNSVSLRSKRLIEFAPKHQLEWKSFHGFFNEDGFICVNYRHEYEQAGLKFASIEVAKYFSKEHEIPENKGILTFAFHSIGKWDN